MVANNKVTPKSAEGETFTAYVFGPYNQRPEPQNSAVERGTEADTTLQQSSVKPVQVTCFCSDLQP